MANQVYAHQQQDQTVSIGDWILSYFLMCIPLVGFIMLFVWAFGDQTKPSKKNWARASLIVQAILIILVTLFYVLVIAAAGGLVYFFGY